MPAENGKRDINYIAGKVDAIHEDVKILKGTSVTKDYCVDRHKRISEDIHRVEDKIKEATSPGIPLVSMADSSPSLPAFPPQEKHKEVDIWSWLGRRLPVILGMCALLGGLGAAYKMLLLNQAATDETRDLMRQNANQPAKIKVIKIPINHYIPVFPDAGARRAPIRRHRRGAP